MLKNANFRMAIFDLQTSVKIFNWQNIKMKTIPSPLWESLTWSEVEPDATKEVLVTEPVVIPHPELEAPVCQVLDAEILPGKGLVPARWGRLPTHSSLLLPSLMARQQVAGSQILNFTRIFGKKILKFLFYFKPFQRTHDEREFKVDIVEIKGLQRQRHSQPIPISHFAKFAAQKIFRSLWMKLWECFSSSKI